MKRKRGQGEGCITKRKDGKWASVITVGRNADGLQKRRFFYGKTRQEVAAKLTKALNDLKSGMYVDINKIMLKDWLQTWLYDFKINSIKPKTLESYSFIVNCYLIPCIGYIYIQDLKMEHVQSMLNSLSKRKLSPRTIKYTYIILHSALDQAVKNNIIVKNVSNNVITPKQAKHEIKILSLEEQNIFIRCIESHRLYVAFVLLLSTGVRIGELLALTWDNVDFDNAVIKITQNLQRVKVFDNTSKTKTKLIFGTPKTDKGRRFIPLLDDVVSLLKVHKEKQSDELSILGLSNEKTLVFCSEIGTAIEPRSFTRTFKSLLKKANISNINIHALRHTFATRGLENGIELKIMQEILGHSSISVTGDIYSHVLLDKKKDSINKLKGIFNLSISENHDSKH